MKNKYLANSLTKEEIKRYSKHLILPEVGKEGQEKLKSGKVLIIGLGGLGSPAAIYLACAGAGTLGLSDFDNVDESNLQRQILFNTKDIGKSKLESAEKTIRAINPYVKVNLHNSQLTSKNAVEVIKDYDVVIDGTDNFQAKYLINDACVLLNKPNVYGSVFRFVGQSSLFNYKNGPCYRCIFPKLSQNLIPSCADEGVLGVLPGVIGTIQATEALKILLGIGETLSGRLLIYNALSMKFTELRIKKNKDCICSQNKAVELNDESFYNESFCNKSFYSIKNCEMQKIENQILTHELKLMLDRKEDFILVDVREKPEWEICNIKGSRLIPLSQIKKGNLDGIKDKDKLIVLHCGSGNRSIEALKILRDKGYRNLKSLAGGMSAWKNLEV